MDIQGDADGIREAERRPRISLASEIELEVSKSGNRPQSEHRRVAYQ